MGRKELVVKSLVWWIVPTVLVFAALMYLFDPVKPKMLFLCIGALMAVIIYWTDEWRDWLRE